MPPISAPLNVITKFQQDQVERWVENEVERGSNIQVFSRAVAKFLNFLRGLSNANFGRAQRYFRNRKKLSENTKHKETEKIKCLVSITKKVVTRKI